MLKFVDMGIVGGHILSALYVTIALLFLYVLHMSLEGTLVLGVLAWVLFVDLDAFR